MTEQWRAVPGWEGRYEVSDQGRVRSLDMAVGARGGGTAIRKGRVLALVWKGCRYMAVTLADKERRVQYLLHDLVLLAFVGEKPKGMQGAHGDGDRRNNRLSNLRYATPKENAADKRQHGTHQEGERHHRAKLTEAHVREIRASTEDRASLADLYGVSPEHIWQIRARRCWKHLTP